MSTAVVALAVMAGLCFFIPWMVWSGFLIAKNHTHVDPQVKRKWVRLSFWILIPLSGLFVLIGWQISPTY